MHLRSLTVDIYMILRTFCLTTTITIIVGSWPLISIAQSASSIHFHQESELMEYERSLEVISKVNRHQIIAIQRDLDDKFNYQPAKYKGAIYFDKKSLKTVRPKNKQGEAYFLHSIGIEFGKLRQYEQAIECLEEALTIRRTLNNLDEIADSLHHLGHMNLAIDNYQRALNLYNESLEIRSKVGDHEGQASTLNGLGIIYNLQGDYAQAVEYHEASLKISEEINNQIEASIALNGLGRVYENLGNNNKALIFYTSSLQIRREIDEQKGVVETLNNLGAIYIRLGEYEQALSLYSEGLEIAETLLGTLFYIPDQVNLLNGLGNVNLFLGNSAEAIKLHQEALAITRENGNRKDEATTLIKIGNAYADTANYTEAIKAIQQALNISKALQSRPLESLALSSLASYLESLGQIELSIIFYKASVHIHESIRDDIQGLSSELQQFYTDTITDSYQALADLLLQENRILEAQLVLELLTLQELDDYFQDIQRSEIPQTGISQRRGEQAILNLYIDTVLAAERLTQLEAIPEDQRTTEEQEEYDTLINKETQLSREFFDFIDLPEVQSALKTLKQTAEGTLNPEEFKQLQNNLANLPTRSALLYTLILDKRLELVLVNPDVGAVRVPIEVDAATLNRTIVEFGQALSTPNSNPEPLAQQLYTWLIAPLEEALEAAQVETLLYAPDGALRYIPLAALHDGDQWLAKKLSITNITAASLTDFDTEPSGDIRLFAGACTECSFSFEVNGEPYTFSDLPATETEVTALANLVTDNKIVLNESFSPKALEDNRGAYNIMHLATHAAFVEGSPRDSFIVFGDGSQVSLQTIRREWTLDKQELIVLSACETAVGQWDQLTPDDIDADTLGNGAEILGLGFQIQNSGAQSVMASLWQVSDDGTQQLMNAFYTALLADGMTKTEALQAAQKALITGQLDVTNGQRASINVLDSNTNQPLGDRLAHPYYWAPFILIGNGL